MLPHAEHAAIVSLHLQFTNEIIYLVLPEYECKQRDPRVVYEMNSDESLDLHRFGPASEMKSQQISHVSSSLVSFSRSPAARRALAGKRTDSGRAS
jgi:hypothetical protein